MSKSELVLTTTDTGSKKLQYRGEITSKAYFKELLHFLNASPEYKNLRWPTLYFGADKPVSRAVLKAKITPTKDDPNSIIKDEDLPWVL